ncbi:MAG TPA: fumarylacetoacetate hydrolase family protein [Candidatus Dormibacteraeota bacterium]|nr:fumarylacetoacetate hydrolase family protein [Candidatus Dormibacteraeota bacterium]
MKLCRFQPLQPGSDPRSSVEHRQNPAARRLGDDAARYGMIDNERVFEIAEPFRRIEQTGTSWPLAGVKLLPPCQPSKIVCVGRNYKAHAAELGNDLPTEPLIFLKPPSAIIAPNDPIVLTRSSERVDFEGELAIVIGKTCARLKTSEDIKPYVLGYTCLNDVTARDLQIRDVQFTRAKSFDTFCPFGPVIETGLDPATATVETFLNTKRRQSARVTEMIFPVDVIIRWISQVMTLLPGDVIATGTPSGVGPLADGDMVEVSVGGVGTLRNPVRAPQ